MDYRLFCLVAIAFVVSSFSTANGQAALTQEQCSVQPLARVNCGEPGITPTECVNKGCCFDDSDHHAIWCYYAKPNDDQAKRPAMDYRLFCLVAIAFVVSSFSTANGQAALTQEQCTVQPVARVNCGEAGISPTECFNKGCCFDNSDEFAIWCYYAKPDDGLAMKGEFQGWCTAKITAKSIKMDRRICWMLAAVLLLGVTCSAQTASQCSVAPKARVNCGYPGISRLLCEARGCCFDSSIAGVIWCFEQAALEDVDLGSNEDMIKVLNLRPSPFKVLARVGL
ncbi:uncharacterized protein ACMZJ9_001373 [Mantella aurantiaca]